MNIEINNVNEENVEEILKPYFENVEKICKKNCEKVLNAFIDNKITTTDFAEVNGYGFFDNGRDKVESVFAQVLGAEDALVRSQIMSGTNAIYLTLSALLHPGDTMLSISGLPYDPLQNIIGIRGESNLSFKKNKIKYEQIELLNNDFNYEEIKNRISQGDISLVAIQRSRGYEHREGLGISQIEKVCKLIKEIDKKIIIFVDNCYGELVEEKEPVEVGADIMAGSLMHNLGGGVATSGGYVAGKAKFVNDVAERLTAPGMAKDLGANYNQHNNFLRGLYLAPKAVESAVKTAIYTSYIFEKSGYNVSPRYFEKRTDIVQTIDFLTEEKLLKFCEGLQKSLPVDSIYTPTPCDFPGYPHKEIMASGAFTSGSTLELSCDGPLIDPFTGFMQGGTIFEYSRIMVKNAKEFLEK